MTRREQLHSFVSWLTGKRSQAEADGTTTGRSFRRRIAWCWHLRPTLPQTGEVFDEVQLDGFNLRTGWCLLIASVRGRPVAFQWAGSENQAAWGALLGQLPAPVVVVSDGGSGLHAALGEYWPDTRHQRCLVHVQRNVRRYVTARSKTAAGQALWGISLRLTRVRNMEDVSAWLLLFSRWEAEHLPLTKQRTYAREGLAAPSWTKPGQKWWYTHQRLRSAYFVLRRRIRAGDLFAFLDTALAAMGIASTTNQIEGGINALLRDLLKQHRGLDEQHQRRAMEWWLYTHHPAGLDATDVLHDADARARAAAEAEAARASDDGNDSDEPTLYDTGLSAEEGLWARSGWAGRA